MSALIIICAYLAPSIVLGIWAFLPGPADAPMHASRLMSFAGMDQ